LKCPHGKEIVIEKKMGVTVFSHNGGDKCDILSQYNASPHKVSKVLVDRHIDKIDLALSDKIIFSIQDQKSVVSYFAEAFKHVNNTELYVILLYIERIKAQRLKKALLKIFGYDLEVRFNKVMFSHEQIREKRVNISFKLWPVFSPFVEISPNWEDRIYSNVGWITLENLENSGLSVVKSAVEFIERKINDALTNEQRIS
jgi:hypothetical protein